MGELGVAVAAGVRLAVLDPQEHQRDAGPTELSVDLGPAGDRPVVDRRCRRLLEPARASRAASSSSAGRGQVSPAALARRTWSATVVKGIPTERPTSRWDRPSPPGQSKDVSDLAHGDAGSWHGHLLGAVPRRLTASLSSCADRQRPSTRCTKSSGAGVRIRPERACENLRNPHWVAPDIPVGPPWRPVDGPFQRLFARPLNLQLNP